MLTLVEPARSAEFDRRDPSQTHRVRVATRAAAQIARLLECALRVGEATAVELFGENEASRADPLAGASIARMQALAERLFPQAQDRVFAAGAQVVRCVAVDRSGRVAVRRRAPVAHEADRIDVANVANAAETAEVTVPIVVGRRCWGELRIAFVRSRSV